MKHHFVELCSHSRPSKTPKQRNNETKVAEQDEPNMIEKRGSSRDRALHSGMWFGGKIDHMQRLASPGKMLGP